MVWMQVEEASHPIYQQYVWHCISFQSNVKFSFFLLHQARTQQMNWTVPITVHKLYMNHTWIIHELYQLLIMIFKRSTCNAFTYDYTVHVQFMYSSCTIHVQFMYSSGHSKPLPVYSSSTVYVSVQFICDQDYSKEQQQTRPPSQLKQLWSHPIGKQHWWIIWY